ncbi:MAG TPA: response regulator [Desulfuromonadales bacterium]|nr:response regulator [Desulfuromonadales bacterium]
MTSEQATPHNGIVSPCSSKEQQKQQSQKMEAIGQLAGGISHDFNNLLTVILGYSSLALQKIGAEHPAAKDIEQVINAGDRAETLIRQLLVFGRRQILAPQPMQVNTFIAGLHKILCRLIGDNIALTTQLAPDICKVMADPGQIEQIIMNLVINARDAMQDTGGTITITTENCTLNETFTCNNPGAIEGDYVMFSVKDNGIGISHEDSKKLFEPYFSTKPETGTGLGLSTIYGIVKQNSGYIQVISALGSGAEFRVYLPKLSCVPENKVRDAESYISLQKNDGAKKLILVVEDDLMVLNLAAASLRLEGYDVLMAQNPLEALRIFDRNAGKIDLLLTDIMMPDMNGIEMARKMHSVCPDMNLLFMTGYSDEHLKTYDFTGEKYRFMMKPFSPAELTKLVAHCLQFHTTPEGLRA